VAGFSRATEIVLAGCRLLFISGTASVGARRESRHGRDFEAQARHTYRNLEGILGASGFTPRDVVKWTVFLKEMKYYDRFNRVRDEFLRRHGLLESPPASTCVQAVLCRPELLVEIEALAIRPAHRKARPGKLAYHLA
jgi:enamine deaminase RidA (YjgF/YER057c/UK114 family)